MSVSVIRVGMSVCVCVREAARAVNCASLYSERFSLQHLGQKEGEGKERNTNSLK